MKFLSVFALAAMIFSAESIRFNGHLQTTDPAPTTDPAATTDPSVAVDPEVKDSTTESPAPAPANEVEPTDEESTTGDGK